MNLLRSSFVLAALAASSLLPAQDAVPALSRPFMRIAADTPPRLEKEFAGTRFGEMLASEDFDAWWASVQDQIDASLDDDGEDSAAEARLRELLTAIDGRLSVEVEFELGDFITTGQPDMFLIIALSSEDAEALDEIQVLMRELIEEEQDDVIEVEIAGRTFLSVESPDGDATALLPMRFGDALVMFVGSDVEESVAKCLDRSAEPVGDDGEPSDVAPIEFQLDVAQVVDIIRVGAEARIEADAAADQGEGFGGMQPDVAAIMQAMRVDSLREMSMSVQPVTDRVVMEIAVTSEAGRPSLFDLMRPIKPGDGALLALAPRHHDYWSLSTFRIDDFLELISDVLQASGAPINMMALEGMFAMQFEGLQLRGDLLDHLGDELLALQSIPDPAQIDMDAEDPAADATAVGMAIEVSDPEALAKTIDRLVQVIGLEDARKTHDYRGIEVHDLPMDGQPDVSWTYGRDFIAFGMGKAGAGLLGAILDAELLRRAGEEPGPFGKWIEERLGLMPQGWSSVSVTDLTPAFDLVLFALEVGDADITPAGIDAMRGFFDLLKRFELGKVVGTSAVTDGRTVMRSVW